ncbi:MAG: lyase family protein [Candidatus Andersenbacteria bacterium]
MADRNLQLPGNPRYQPKDLQPYFGYDNLYRGAVVVELAALSVLIDHELIPQECHGQIVDAMESLMSITTTEVDRIEREVTRHDVRALVRCIQERLPEDLRRWVHVLLTSYDVLDTARALTVRRAHEEDVEPKLKLALSQFKDLIVEYADVPQVGRTHGQHAIPITVGFWLATVASRLLHSTKRASRAARRLVGKASGPVGAHNAAVLFGLPTFQEELLKKLRIEPAPISTQIVPPEPLAEYLFACLECSAALGQFGRDCRNLMRTEIGEVVEAFEEGQVGSSTMAHKRNPINFESLEGMWQRSRAEFGKVLETLISEHQRDLTGSAPLRDTPIMVVNLVQQLNTLLRADKQGRTFLSRIRIDREACERNLRLQGNRLAAEAAYIGLQFHGYAGDAHELVNRELTPVLGTQADATLWELLEARAETTDPALREPLAKFSEAQQDVLLNVPPTQYIGNAAHQARLVAGKIALWTREPICPME